MSSIENDVSVAKLHRLLPRGRRLAVLAALFTTSLGGLLSTHAARMTPPAKITAPIAAAAPLPPVREIAGVDPEELARKLCALKDSVRFRSQRWARKTCAKIALAVLESADKHNLSPALLLGVMLNESDLDENVVTHYKKAGAVYAQDAGLMGIRCVYDGRGRCNNGIVKGMRPRDTLDPATNIELGAQILAMARKGDGVERRTVRRRDADGNLVTATKLVRCRHSSHAYWAHYNHGSFYISRGAPRHYPHRVGVLYFAMAQGLGLPAEELFTRPLTVKDPGRQARTADRPVEPRFRVLVDKIYRATGLRTPGSDVAFASLSPARNR